MADHSGRKVTLDQKGNLLLIGLNRPEKRNAADTEMLSQLALAYGELEKNPDLRGKRTHSRMSRRKVIFTNLPQAWKNILENISVTYMSTRPVLVRL